VRPKLTVLIPKKYYFRQNSTLKNIYKMSTIHRFDREVKFADLWMDTTYALYQINLNSSLSPKALQRRLDLAEGGF
jgi:hypothetical protein